MFLQWVIIIIIYVRCYSDRMYFLAVSEAAEVYLMRLDAKDGKTYSDREKNEQKPAHYKHIKVGQHAGIVILCYYDYDFIIDDWDIRGWFFL